MAKYQKKPVIIEAFQWGDDLTPEWGAEAFVEGKLTEVDTGIDLELHIETLEGEMVAEQGDFIIKGVHGEIYIVENLTFLKKRTSISTTPTPTVSALMASAMIFMSFYTEEISKNDKKARWKCNG